MSEEKHVFGFWTDLAIDTLIWLVVLAAVSSLAKCVAINVTEIVTVLQ